MPMNSKGKKRVLVIDDDQDVRSLFVKTLEPEGFDVVTSADPDTGVEGARETEPDLIFISLIFPNSNGLKVSKAIHADEILRKVPIVMLITQRGELDPKYTATIGVVDVLAKPLDAGEILAKTFSLVGGDLILPELGKKASRIPDEEEMLLYSLEKEFADLEREEPVTREESPWDNEFTDFETEEISAEADIEGTTQSAVNKSAGGEAGDFFDYEMENGIAAKEGDISSGQAKEDRERENRSGRDDFVPEEEILPEPKKSPFKKIITAVGVVAIIAGVGIGALRLIGSFSRDSGGPVKKEAAKKEGIPKRVKPEESASAPEAGKPGKNGSAAPTPGETKNENTHETADTQKAAKLPGQPIGTEQAKAVKPASTYSVQVGYFKEGRNASTLVEGLKQKGYDAFLYEGAGEKGKRVLIGRFSGREQALEESRLILKDEGLKTVVYRY